jgi:hypothetical protein
LKKIIYVKLKLIDKIKNKYNFDKRAKNKKKEELKLKHQQQRGQTCNFQRRREKTRGKKGLLVTNHSTTTDTHHTIRKRAC